MEGNIEDEQHMKCAPSEGSSPFINKPSVTYYLKTVAHSM